MIIKPGICNNLSNAEYHAADGISASGIKLLLRSPHKYWYQYLSGQCERTQSKPMMLGSALHKLVLEPDSFFQEFVFMPETIKIRSGKEWEKFAAANADRAILSYKEYQHVQAMAEATLKHPIFSKIHTTGLVEHSIFWLDESGALLKSRPDWFNDEFVIDVKTTSNVDPDAFARSVAEYRYDIQAAMQLDALEIMLPKEQPRKHIMLCVEEEEPHLTDMFMLPQEALGHARSEYQRGAILYEFYKSNNIWEHHNDFIKSIQMPAWFINKQQ